MQRLQGSSNDAAAQAADQLLHLVPEVMYFLRASLRNSVGTDLTVPQARVLVIIQRRPGGTLSAIADMLGISVSAASRIVDGLVTRKLVSRQACTDDRRNLRLLLTPSGNKTLAKAVEIGRSDLIRRLSQLSPGDMKRVHDTCAQLRPLFDETQSLHLVESVPRTQRLPATCRPTSSRSLHPPAA